MIETVYFLFICSKPHIKPVEVVPIYPDFKNWKFPCAQVIFDSDPAPANSNKNFQAQMDEMAQAMIRFVDAFDSVYSALFVRRLI